MKVKHQKAERVTGKSMVNAQRKKYFILKRSLNSKFYHLLRYMSTKYKTIIYYVGVHNAHECMVHLNIVVPIIPR